ncbi:hypothetical protein [Catenuloplanes japonicus]|uniref:hypothetical protein n=1 Tax=Catenuloplanes japonicus TaxID=33876 RepID=UPI001E2DE77B|nr:hypothetical protein [Catenuloplanes japonicus]
MEQSQPAEPDKPEQVPAEPVVPQPVVPPVAGPPGVGPPGVGPPGVGPGGSAAGPAKGRRSWKTVLLVVASVMGVLCSGTVGYGLWRYNEETKPDRSAPDVAVSNYLRAFLSERDDNQASLYVCGSPDLNSMSDFRDDIENREMKYSIAIRVSWSGLEVADAQDGRQVQTTIRRSISDGSESDKSVWSFAVVDEGGWRVCSARRLS